MEIKRSTAKLHKSKAEVPEMTETLRRSIFLFLLDVGGCGNCDCDYRYLSGLPAKENPNGFAYDRHL